MLTTAQRDRWADALESGEYEQVRNHLFSDEPPKAFCCLGVLTLGVDNCLPNSNNR